MNNTTRFTFLLLTVSIFFTSVCYGQSPEKLLGQPYNSPELTKLRSTFQSTEGKETFLPYLKIYKLDYVEDGIVTEYNSDISLFRVALYDSGYTYKAYKGELPFKAYWGMPLKELEKTTGFLEFDKSNVYIRNYTTDQYVISYYFENEKLNHIKIAATIQTLKDKTKEVLAGTGMRLLPTGKKIDGNIIDGTGSMVWGDGAAIYRGEWAYGLPQGNGQYTDSFGNKYEGEFKLGFFWGQGKFYSEQLQYSYDGNYAMSMRHDTGVIAYPNNSSYKGSWVQDNMEGYGTYIRGKSYVYVGEMKNNTLNGEGALKTPDGYITGTFKNGKPHGTCTQVTTDGSISLVGTFVNGLKEGNFKATNFGLTRDVFYEKGIEIQKGEVDPKLLDKQ